VTSDDSHERRKQAREDVEVGWFCNDAMDELSMEQ
jgi:hypothetical protein